MIRYLSRPFVRAFVRSALPDDLLELAQRLSTWCRIQRAYLIGESSGLALERDANYLPAAWAAGDWWEERREYEPWLPSIRIEHDFYGPRLIPQEAHDRYVVELDRLCKGRSSWV